MSIIDKVFIHISNKKCIWTACVPLHRMHKFKEENLIIDKEKYALSRMYRIYSMEAIYNNRSKKNKKKILYIACSLDVSERVYPDGAVDIHDTSLYVNVMVL